MKNSVKRFSVFFILFNFYLGALPLPSKALICGVCKDVESRLPYSIEIMEQMGVLFEDYKIVVYENNSQDGTKKILKNWSDSNKKVLILSEDLEKEFLSNTIINRINKNDFFRPELIAYARNKVLNEIMSDRYNEFSSVIWMDMDFKIFPRIEGLIEIFNSEKEWDAVFAYGISPDNEYWDWYAFRDSTEPLGPELLGNSWWYDPKKKKLLTFQNDWYPVYSAFGGCGVYKRSSIMGCRYSALVTEELEKVSHSLIKNGLRDNHPQIIKYHLQNQELKTIINLSLDPLKLKLIEDPLSGFIIHNSPDALIWKMNSFVYNYPSVCEHVTFHASMILNGHNKLFINPRFIFYYGDSRPIEE